MDIHDWIAAIDAADKESIRSQAAFVTGRFDSYLAERAAESEARLAEAIARLDAIYDGPADEPNDAGAAGSRTPRGDGE
jgi:2-methylisocitrate lyase-like PEP mutase family enzyme